MMCMSTSNEYLISDSLKVLVQVVLTFVYQCKSLIWDGLKQSVNCIRDNAAQRGHRNYKIRDIFTEDHII